MAVVVCERQRELEASESASVKDVEFAEDLVKAEKHDVMFFIGLPLSVFPRPEKPEFITCSVCFFGLGANMAGGIDGVA